MAAPADKMNREVAALDDGELARELAFAVGFADPMPTAKAWLEALLNESARRERPTS